MKILYTLNSGNYGGMEKHVLDLCEGMKNFGHEVHVWCASGPLELEFQRQKITHKVKKIGLDIDPVYIISLAYYLKKHQIDILHSHELKAVVNSLLAATLAGVKVKISHTHTPISEWQISPLKKQLNLFVYPKVVNNFATFEIALTDSRQKIKAQEGIKEHKLKVLPTPNAIKLENFNFAEGEKERYHQEIRERHEVPVTANLIGCVGRISEEKGQVILVEAFSEYLKKLSRQKAENTYLMLIGGGPLQDLVEHQIDQLGLSKKVIITGRFSDEDKKKYYAALDYFVHPSLAEGFGLVLIEAMAVRLPVIASNLEVFKEVSGDTVVYFNRGDAQDLAEKLYQLTETGQISSKIEQAHQKVLENYTFEKFTSTYQDFYLKLLKHA